VPGRVCGTTGEVAVTRVVVGQDSGLMINPDGVRHQIHGNVIPVDLVAHPVRVDHQAGILADHHPGHGDLAGDPVDGPAPMAAPATCCTGAGSPTRSTSTGRFPERPPPGGPGSSTG
jgi:hypothetical protein